MENGDLSQPTYFVEEDKIAHNIAVLKNRVGQRRIYAVLKADGYGLGVEKLASVYAANGLDCFAVTNLQQVRAVAKSVENIRELLLMSAPMPQQIPELAELQVSFSVSTREQLRQLEPYSANVHLQVDTGLGRRGFPWTDIPTILRQYTETKNVHFVGIYTHLIDGGNTKTTQLQMQRFSAVLSALENAGIQPGIRHFCASSAVFGQEQWLMDGVRMGTALLGRSPGGEKHGLQATGYCLSPVENIRTVHEGGTTVGYGGTFCVPKNRKLALVPVGTRNGFGLTTGGGKEKPGILFLRSLRQMRNGVTGRGVPGAVIGGKFCPAVGRIFTEAVLLDVTDVACEVSDVARLNINPIYCRDMPICWLPKSEEK